MPNGALLWTWVVAAEEYHMIISKCIRAGYYLNVYHRPPQHSRIPEKQTIPILAWRLVHLIRMGN